MSLSSGEASVLTSRTEFSCHGPKTCCGKQKWSNTERTDNLQWRIAFYPLSFLNLCKPFFRITYIFRPSFKHFLTIPIYFHNISTLFSTFLVTSVGPKWQNWLCLGCLNFFDFNHFIFAPYFDCTTWQCSCEWWVLRFLAGAHLSLGDKLSGGLFQWNWYLTMLAVYCPRGHLQNVH